MSRSRRLTVLARLHRVDYRGGERYPHLLRVEAKPDTLDDLAKPLAK